MNDPTNLICQWLQEERDAGAPNPQQAVLATCASTNIPHGRVVAIREINNDGLLFFTQRGTRKVAELNNNPNATIVFWFELKQREIIIEGTTLALSSEENNHYWQQYPREAQIRFYAYAPTSSQSIQSKNILEEKKRQLNLDFHDKELPISSFYCGFRLKPKRILFYTYRTDELSDVVEYTHTHNAWSEQTLSP